MQLETVKFEKKEGIIVISLNRPKVLNAVNQQLIADLLTALEAAEADSEAKVVVLRGEGRAFCSGADLSQGAIDHSIPVENRPDTLQDITRAIVRMSKVVIAAVHGYAIGAGLELAEDADMRIVAEGTKFGATETNVGSVVTNAGTKLLTYYIGLGRAKELYFTNEFMDAQEALQYGLANKVVPPEELEEAAMKMAVRISKNSALSLMLTKQAVNRALGMSIEETLVMEARDLQVSTLVAEQGDRRKEAMQRLKEKE
ncbi:MAG: enoyl-CoA hydratase/isomerase family protein [Deltaproteobacteria bacterium]|nr:enoyl-CoA hydratase/isomerase family protein [Deltaproteobacteria bacterium]